LTCIRKGATYSVVWNVERRQLASQDRKIASPSFLVSFGNRSMEYSCKLVLDSRDFSFYKSHGLAKISIKCENVCGCGRDCGYSCNDWKVSASFRVGEGSREQPSRGPVIHNFSESATCALPDGLDVWDLRSSLYRTAKTVRIQAEITPMGLLDQS